MLKKTLLALGLAAVALTTHAANFVSVDVERVKDDTSGVISNAQYVRAGVDALGLNLGLQVRTAAFDGGGMVNSMEGTVAKGMGPLSVFGGVGHDNGFNGGRAFQYGLVGASTGMPLGPVFVFGGVKTRLNWDDMNPKQTVAFAGVSKNVTKDVSLSVGVGKSYQDIKESSWGVGLRVGF